MIAIDRESYEAMHELNALRREFRGTQCFCGNAKAAGRPFCNSCRSLLPHEYERTHLFSPSAQFFTNAYVNAKGWLRAHGVSDNERREPDLEMTVWALAPDDGRHSGVKRRKCTLRDVPTGWKWEACED